MTTSRKKRQPAQASEPVAPPAPLKLTVDLEQAGELELGEFILINRAQEGNLTTSEQVKVLEVLQKLIKEDISRVKLKDLGQLFKAITKAFDEVANPDATEGN